MNPTALGTQPLPVPTRIIRDWGSKTTTKPEPPELQVTSEVGRLHPFGLVLLWAAQTGLSDHNVLSSTYML